MRVARIEKERVIFTSNQVHIMVMVMVVLWLYHGGFMRSARIEKERVDRSSSHLRINQQELPPTNSSFQEIPTNAQTLHIDCSAAGIKLEAGRKIFDG